MKKVLALILAIAMCSLVFVGCSSTSDEEATTTTATDETTTTTEATASPVTLLVDTTYGTDDEWYQPYSDSVTAWETDTGNTVTRRDEKVVDDTGTRKISDIESGNTADVYYYLLGGSFDSLGLENFVDLDTIIAEYPDYASNIASAALNSDTNMQSDGSRYGVPTIGYAEAIYVNTKLLSDAGIDTVPTTWDEFIDSIKALDEAGIQPVSCALGATPNYWFEHVLVAGSGADSIKTNPKDATDVPTWETDIELLKAMYDAGAFASDAADISGDDDSQAFLQGKAAYYAGGSWDAGSIQSSEDLDPADIEAIAVPSNCGKTDMISGYSSGWVISQAAWDDADKRAAAVDFVLYMTSDEVIGKFVEDVGGVAAAPNAGVTSEDKVILQKVIKAIGTASGITGAIEDSFTKSAKEDGMMTNCINVATGDMSGADFVADIIDKNNA